MLRVHNCSHLNMDLYAATELEKAHFPIADDRLSSSVKADKSDVQQPALDGTDTSQSAESRDEKASKAEKVGGSDGGGRVGGQCRGGERDALEETLICCICQELLYNCVRSGAVSMTMTYLSLVLLTILSCT